MDISTLNKEYKAGLQYHTSMGFSDTWPTCIAFREGDQWPAPTEATRHMPRPVHNICDFVCRHKVSSVLASNVRMTYASEELPQAEGMDGRLDMAVEGARLFTSYAETLWDEVEQDDLNESVMSTSATVGTGVWHYYWDPDASGGIVTRYRGRMMGEPIDPACFFVGDPQVQEVQKQPWIIISSRRSVASVRELAKANRLSEADISLIVPDRQEGRDGEKTELPGSEMCTLLTRYWREGGQVHICQFTQSVIVKPPVSMGQAFTRYPVEVFYWRNRHHSLFGIGEVEALLPSQKAINFTMAMMMLSVQSSAWPKLVAKPMALQQTVTNSPGEILVDHHTGGGDGIKYLQPASISNMALSLTDKIMELTRSLTGSTEVATGEPFTRDLNAAAIIALQNASKVPIEQLQARYHRCIRNIGRIWECFFKQFYNMDRTITVHEADGSDTSTSFNGSRYAEFPFAMKIDVGASSLYSESLAMASLDKLWEKGTITDEMYIELAPDNVLPFKERLRRMREEEALKAPPPAPPAPTGLDPRVRAILDQMGPEELAAIEANPDLLNTL